MVLPLPNDKFKLQTARTVKIFSQYMMRKKNQFCEVENLEN
jgi:hypothetical protein